MGANFERQECGCYIAPNKLVPCEDHKLISATMAQAASAGSADSELDPDEVKDLVESVRET